MNQQEWQSVRVWQRQYHKAVRPWRVLTWLFGVLTIAAGCMLIPLVLLNEQAIIGWSSLMQHAPFKGIGEYVLRILSDTQYAIDVEVLAGCCTLLFVICLLLWKIRKHRFTKRRFPVR